MKLLKFYPKLINKLVANIRSMTLKVFFQGNTSNENLPEQTGNLPNVKPGPLVGLNLAALKMFVIGICLISFCCNAQQSNKDLIKIENHLKAGLDYTNGALEIFQKQQNGEEMILGKISTEGIVSFDLPLFNIKAIYDSIPLQHYNFQSLFLMDSSCKDRDVFAKTPFNDIYAQKYDPMYIKKYGEEVAILFPATDEKMFDNNDYYINNSYDGKSLTVGAKYYWFYMDRTIPFKDNCIKTPLRNASNIEIAINANISLNKGWNFIEEKLVAIQKYSVDDHQGIKPKKIQFTKSSPASKKVKWFLIQIMKDEKIEAAKKLYELDPISKEQFTKWLPKKVGEFTRTSYELDKKLEQSSCKTNNAVLTFENGNKKFEITVLDGAKNPDDLEMVNFSFAMDTQFKREDKPENDPSFKEGEVHHISKYDEKTKTTHILSVFKDRIVLYASGENITPIQLWGLIKELKIESIIQ